MRVTDIIVLAGGKGSRMKHHLPKVMVELDGRPLIDYVVSAVESSGVTHKPIVVISPAGQSIRDELGDRAQYVVQAEQLGTGHAARCALPEVVPEAKQVIVLYGDQPLIRPQTIREISETHTTSNGPLTMMTITVPNYEGLYESLYDFGRIVRDTGGQIRKIVEMKDASPEEQQLRELNPSIFCFDRPWLMQAIERLTPHNAQHELYLTDLVEFAMAEGHAPSSVDLPPEQAIGINTPEQLRVAETLLYSTQASAS